MTDITGTAGNDVLIGTTAEDVIDGLSGSDRLEGREGDDTLRGGGGGWDELNGGEGNDILIAGPDGAGLADGPGDDIVDGGAARDFFYNGSGSDVLRGGGGQDEYQISRGLETDTITVVDGDGPGRARLLIAGASTVIADMGAGDDTVDVDFFGGHGTFTLGAGRDVVNIGVSQAQKLGEVSIVLTDYELGRDADRIGILDFMARALSGWNQALSPFASGHARLVQSGNDALLQLDLDGGGNFYRTLITFQDRAVASFDPANLDGYLPDGSIPAGLQIAGDGAARLYGLAGADRIDGGAAGETVLAGAGNDVVSGGGGSNSLYGQSGDDELQGGEDYDYIDGGYGDDRVFGGGGNDYLVSERGVDLVDGGAGDDRIYVTRGSLTDNLVTIAGGTGKDQIDIISWGRSDFDVDAGFDDDTIQLGPLAGTANLTLGLGSDRVVLGTFEGLRTATTGLIAIADMGAGDAIDFLDFLALHYAWEGDNPFGNGLFRLAASGADSVLELSQGGSGYRPFIVFKDIQPAGLTADNFSGYSPDGTPPPSLHLVGDAFANRLEGKAGNDRIEGEDGADSLHGGPGADTISGGGGDDYAHGGAGNDEIDGGDGRDFIHGGSGDDIMRGGAGDDEFMDEAGSLVVHGGDGNDKLFIQHLETGETVQFYGGAGADSFDLNAAYAGSWIFDGGVGDDLMEISALAGTAQLWLGAGADRLVLKGSFGTDGHKGGIVVADFDAAADTVSLSGFLAEFLFGWDGSASPFSTGHLRLVQSRSDARLEIDRDAGGGMHDWATKIVFLNLSAVTLGAANLGYSVPMVWGTPADDLFTGRAAADAVNGAGGNDIFYHGSTLTAGDSNDGGPGTDTLILQGDYPALALGAASLVAIEGLSLQSGSVTRWGQSGLNSYDYDLALHDANVAAGRQLRVNAQSLQAGEDFTFDGAAETDGSFLLYGGFGTDRLAGGAGNDIFFFEAGRFGPGDRVAGNGGSDAVVVSGAPAGWAGAMQVTIAAGALTGIEAISFNGRFASDPAARPVYRAVLEDGNIAPGASLIVNGSSLAADQGLSFSGWAVGDGSLRIFGGAGGDELKGGARDDVIAGGGLGDALWGGYGRDVFVYRSVADSAGDACDVIADFHFGNDSIDLSAIDANLIAAGDQAFAWIGAAAFTGKPGELRAAFDPARNLWAIQGDVNGDGVTDFQLYVSTGAGAPPVADFVL